MANLGPLAEDLQVTAEEMQFLVSSSWKDDKQQFEELVKLGLSKNVEESTVKLALHNRSKTKGKQSYEVVIYDYNEHDIEFKLTVLKKMATGTFANNV